MGSKNSQPVPAPRGNANANADNNNGAANATSGAPSSVVRSNPLVPSTVVSPAIPPPTTSAAPPPPRADEPTMDLFIKTWMNNTIPIGDVRASDNIAALSRKVASAAGTPVEIGQLVYAGKQLEDRRTVGDYDIMRSSTLHWVKRGTAGSGVTAIVSSPAVVSSSSSAASIPVPTSAPSADTSSATLAASPVMQSIYIPTPGGEATTIFVRTFTGKTLTLDVQTSDPMRMVKIQIETQTNIPPIDQRLVFSGRQLDDNVTLGEYAIARESTIHLARPNPTASRIG